MANQISTSKKAKSASTKEDKTVSSFRRALEADDIGYYFLKLSILGFFYFLSSLEPNIHRIAAIVRYPFFVSFVFIIIVIMVKAYGITHEKIFWKAINDFL